MNERCSRKDCIYKPVCMSMFDHVQCSMYENKGVLPIGIVGVGPTDLQESLIPRNQREDAL